MTWPNEIIRIILEKKWFNFRKEYLEKVLSMPTKETFVDPFCSRNTLDFAWFSYKHDNPYYNRHYAFRDITYCVLIDGSIKIPPYYQDDSYYTLFD
jgi:hypothetical protein